MLRAIVRSALIAALVIVGMVSAPNAVAADPAPCRQGDSRPQCKNVQVTGCNANNPRPNRGCPRKLGPNSPVCGKGRHVGNPHCRPAAGGTRNPPGPGPNGGPKVESSQTRVRSVARRTTPRATPRANRAVAPRANKAVATRAAKAL